MKTEEEVRHFFEHGLYDQLLKLEQYRLKKIKVIKIEFWISICAILLFTSFLFVSHPVSLILFFCIMLCIAILFNSIGKMNSYLRFRYKDKIVQSMLAFIFNDFTYIPNQRIAARVLQASGLMPEYVAKAEGEDYMRFRLGETSVHFCETRVLSGGEKLIFEGIFLSATFPKSFRSQTLILPRSFSLKAKAFIHDLFADIVTVKMEDPVFSKKYIILSNDQVEARYLLSTSLMERLLNYSNKIDRKISFSFTGNLLHCAISKKLNLFEPALFESFLDFRFFQKSYNALKLYTDIVEDLHLNVGIWK
jgi:hypothetical protein